jgi:hypothetical protein
MHLEALLSRADAVCGALLDCSQEERLLDECAAVQAAAQRGLQSKQQEIRSVIQKLCTDKRRYNDAIATQALVAQVASESANLRVAQQSAEAQAEQRRKAKGGMRMMAQLYADGTNIVWNYDETTSVLAEQEQTKRVAAGTFHFTQPSLQLRPFRIEIDTQRNKQANFEAANKLWAQMDAHWDAA